MIAVRHARSLRWRSSAAGLRGGRGRRHLPDRFRRCLVPRPNHPACMKPLPSARAMEAGHAVPHASAAVGGGHSDGAELTADGHQALVLNSQRGDKKAFTALVEIYQQTVYGYLRARLIEPASSTALRMSLMPRPKTYEPSISIHTFTRGANRARVRDRLGACMGLHRSEENLVTAARASFLPNGYLPSCRAC